MLLCRAEEDDLNKIPFGVVPLENVLVVRVPVADGSVDRDMIRVVPMDPRDAELESFGASEQISKLPSIIDIRLGNRPYNGRASTKSTKDNWTWIHRRAESGSDSQHVDSKA